MIIFEKQRHHFLALALLLAVTFLPLEGDFLAGQFLGLSTLAWFMVAIAVPIIHQVYVWLIWRLELHFSLISRTFGEAGFLYYAVGFTILFVSRLIAIILLAISNRDTLPLNPTLAFLLSFVLFIPALYLFYSVRTYFGFKRAYGIDHFDQTYRHKPFVKAGIFRWTDNAMYVFGFLILWIPGLLLFSKAALLVAFFNHAYIWVHFYFTELPDIRRIYGSTSTN